MRKRAVISFAAFLIICFLAAFLGLEIAISGYGWYTQLQKPTINLPNWLFVPVWIILYILIAISGWLVYLQEKSLIRRFILQLYGIQLLLHLFWTCLFFGLRSPLLALFDSILLLFTITQYMIMTRNVSRLSALLFAPYIFWAFFATLLNLAIWMLNP